MNRTSGSFGATVGAVVTYLSAVLLGIPPTLHYFPRTGAWGLHALAGEPGIRWFGWLAYALAGALFGWWVGRAIGRRAPWPLVLLLAGTALTLLAWHERTWFAR